MSSPATKEAKIPEITCKGEYLNGALATITRGATKSTHAEMAICQDLAADINSIKMECDAFPCDKCYATITGCKYKIHLVVTGDKGTYSSYYRGLGFLPPLTDATGAALANQASAPWYHFPVHIFFMGGEIVKFSWYAGAQQAPQRFYEGQVRDAPDELEADPARFAAARAGTRRRADSVQLAELERSLQREADLGYTNQVEVNKIRKEIKELEQKTIPAGDRLRNDPAEKWPAKHPKTWPSGFGKK